MSDESTNQEKAKSLFETRMTQEFREAFERDKLFIQDTIQEFGTLASQGKQSEAAQCLIKLYTKGYGSGHDQGLKYLKEAADGAAMKVTADILSRLEKGRI